MCESCFLEEVEKFESQVLFEAFESKLQKKCELGKVEIIDINDENELRILDSSQYYQCSFCGEKWIFSIPENAWRGYFLIRSNALKYHEEPKKNDRRKAVGCWIFDVMLLIVITLLIAT